MSNSILDGFYSLGQNINKRFGKNSTDTEEGIISEKFPELKLDMSNDELIKLFNKREKTWNESNVKAEWDKKWKNGENYWLGKQFARPESDKNRPMVDNVIFEALETYLPQITRRNPEPMATVDSQADQSDENLKFASDIQKKLGDIADELKLRLKLKKVGRNWAIYLLGVAKVGWDLNKDMPTIKILRAQKLILDPEATIDEDGYTGEFIGEYRKMEASILIKILEKIEPEEGAVKFITDMVKDDLGTEVQFKEWWTDDYLCWTLGKQVLLKKKNPHWNYDSEEEAPADETTGETPINLETGQPEMVKVEAQNHFPIPRKPYQFLSVFNLGKQPVDDTSLIDQNLSNQDRINKRGKQIDKNADSMNNGVVVSLEKAGLTKEQASGVTNALNKGGVVAIPTGSPRDAIDRMAANSLPPDVYNDLQDTRNRTLDIFGVRGSTPAGLESDTTVRGKMLNRTLDTDRIGGGITEYLEQFADDLYNWMVQLLYVYDEKYSQIPNKPKVIISVKEGSLLPKDSTTIANQAIELAAANKMSLIDLYKKLDYPNPEELAANVWLEINAPDVLYGNDPRVAQVIQSQQQAAQQAQQEPEKPPSQSMSFKDLPPEGQMQMADKVGIVLTPESLLAKEEANNAAKMPKEPENNQQ